MKTQTVLTVALCALLLVSAFECKKPKDSKNKNPKDESKNQKEKQLDGKQQKEKGQKVEKAKAEKPVKAEKNGKPEEIKVKEVIIEAAEVVESPTNEVQEHDHVAESCDATNHHQQKSIKPRSLKVLNAYEQCKLECKKQRDNIHAQEYVEQLRAELEAAEATLAAEAAADTATSSQSSEPIMIEDNFNN